MNTANYTCQRQPDGESCTKIGDFVFSEERDCLYIVLPHASGKPALDSTGRAALDAIPLSRGQGPRAWRWDGNEDRPTLMPSINWIGHWHGWLTAGELRSC